MTSPRSIFEAHLRRGELAYQFSPAVGRAVFFPRLVCPFTGGDELSWRIASGLGTVHATTVVHPVAGEPYNVALIDCDEGFRMMSRVEGLPPSEVTIGMRVQIRFLPAEGDDAPLPIFTPAC